ncbi:Histidine biosynthesis bifunctional protein hisB [Pseudocyphellaria aurata]|nr:Histidine biosynthesis bifunctional protein hisB [Pseudocyphellaria aurata]
MLIGLCGGICAGKQTIANYLVKSQCFTQLYLDRTSSPLSNKFLAQAQNHESHRSGVEERSFATVESLLDFVTKQWEKRWVTIDVWNEDVLESLLRRPSFILVSVDAPVSLRWTRFKERGNAGMQTSHPDTLDDFVHLNDHHLYDQNFGLAGLIDRAELRLINQTSTLEALHTALKDLDLANDQRLRPSWDQYFMQLASLAARRSNCMKRRVGCVLVREKRVISTGYNGTPRNLRNCNEGGCPRCNAGNMSGVDLSTCLCIHAEENALLEAGRERIREGSILYCDTCPCITCTIKITQVGISEVVYSQKYGMDQEAAAIFKEGGVKLRQFSPVSHPWSKWQGAMPTVHLLDYVAGNLLSLVNAIEKLGYTIEWIKTPEDVEKAEKLVLPGVGHFGHCLTQFSEGGYLEPICRHIKAGKPFLGICVGLQALFESSTESPNVPGFGIVSGGLRRFSDNDKSVPHIGWNSATLPGAISTQQRRFYGLKPRSRYYYVHSYAVPYESGRLEQDGWTVAIAKYGEEPFVGAIGRKNVFATQFHPEKSGVAGLRVLLAFLRGQEWETLAVDGQGDASQGLTRRVIACLDVRSNDHGDLVVTKGDQYDVREKASTVVGGQVRNLGKPVDMARKYYEQGSDEITFLNITSFRSCPLADLPMLEILRQTSKNVFVPLTIGGGIRDTIDTDGTRVSALEVATLYFKSGADKVSIGSDAVAAAEAYYKDERRLTGTTAIETISAAYGNQAVVVSVDPKRVYVKSPHETAHHTIKTRFPGVSGEEYCWYQCTVKGGREGRDIDVRQLIVAVEAMGAGEILLNCIDKDGSNSGFDLELINDVKDAIKIPVISSSGAGNPTHFREVFAHTKTDAALGAGMFHRGEYTIKNVKDDLSSHGFHVREYEAQL